MISKKLLNSQTLNLIKDFKKKRIEIWDVVVYGSFARGKINARDVDVAIILSSKTTLNKKLELAQELKYSLNKILKFKIDVKSIDLSDLIDPLFIARKAILAEGFSLTKKKNLAEIFGFEQFYLFSYNLNGLSHSEKVMFQYALKGRRGEKGLLKITKSEQLGKGVIKAPLQHSEEFKSFFEKNKINYKNCMTLFY